MSNVEEQRRLLLQQQQADAVAGRLRRSRDMDHRLAQLDRTCDRCAREFEKRSSLVTHQRYCGVERSARQKKPRPSSDRRVGIVFCRGAPLVTAERAPDGGAAPFAKDCGCVTHGGPHWLHMDRVDREANRKLVASVRANPPQDFVAADQARTLLRHVAEAEIRRLETKRREMERRGITEIPAAVLARMEEAS